MDELHIRDTVDWEESKTFPTAQKQNSFLNINASISLQQLSMRIFKTFHP